MNGTFVIHRLQRKLQQNFEYEYLKNDLMTKLNPFFSLWSYLWKAAPGSRIFHSIQESLHYFYQHYGSRSAETLTSPCSFTLSTSTGLFFIHKAVSPNFPLD
ncbi:hypothetical protein Anas_11995 [Armadillidium nasatum]|uniref:Uncharacterized protein n=1 Tax=Armadillidium nasatum TaxID=96803 RepID=A0A5N5SK71_9CRUS|nr:hypothetical protein Anas_11995 [Armadillidium nasatum]